MIAQRKYLAALIAAAVLSACGGGSGGDGSITAGTGGTTTPTTGDTTTTPPTGGTTTPPGDTGTTTPPGDGGTTTPPGNGGTTTPPGDTGNGGNNGGNTGGDTVADQTLRGHLRLINDQLIYLRADRSIYNAVTLAQFEGADGMYDVASGATTAPAPAGQVQPPAAAPAAPLASFGFRIDKYVQVDTADQVVGNQTVVGRVAFSFVERPNSAGISASEVAENMSFVIDKVEMGTDAAGQLTTVRVLDGAQMIVTGRNAAGTTVQETIPVSANAVRLLDIAEVLDNYGDTSSVVLLVDLEAAFSQAGTKLAALENLAGNFAMQATLSTVKIVDPADASNAERNLVGSSITVGTQPAVTGAGVSGTAWIRMLPPTP